MNDYKELIETFRLVEEDEEIDICGGVLREIADIIEQLVRDNNVLTKERDAAYEALNRLWECSTCGHYHECGYDDIECVACEDGSEYAFGGVKE